jgi:anion-transporting  ArsA/GET3 family ATPase
MATKNSITVQLSKNSGTPQAVVYVGEKATLAELQGALSGLYKDKTALKAVGLRFCDGCKSGLDIFIRTRFETQINVPGL